MSRQNRRTFLQTSLAAGATVALSSKKSSANVRSANDRVRVAVAGLHGRGKSHMNEFAKMKDVEVAYVVDPDARQFDRAIKQVENISGKAPTPVQDIRTVLNDPNIDAISVATPNHWHSLITIWACQAKKDVYVEKPCSHNVHEGRIAVAAARRHDRIVQHGTQSRSSNGWAHAVAAAQSGVYGKLKVAYGYCYKRRKSIGHKPSMTPPDKLNFDIWLGPAPEQPYHENLVHYNWHWFWDTGNGDIGNQGVHQMDIARWGVGKTLPRSVVGLGGRFGYEDQGETANTQITLFDYGDVQLIFDVRGLETPRRVDNTFLCEDGLISGGKFYPNGSKQGEPLEEVDVSPRGPGNGNFGNFIAAVRSRRQEDLNAEILEGHYSSALCHLANVSYRLGSDVAFSSGDKPFRNSPAAEESYELMREHLAKGNGLELPEMSYRLGRRLEVDAATETIVDDPAANSMLTRKYRAPYVVPDSLA